MTFTKEQLIEDLKTSTQNSSGMFEISDDTICALMSMLTNAAPQLPQPAVPDGYVLVPKEMTDAIGEAIAMQANCCGGIALDIYDAMLAAAPQQELNK